MKTPYRESSMAVDVISDRDDLLKVADRWSDFVGKVRCEVPYLSYPWYAAAIEQLDAEKQPLVLFLKSGEEDIALAPFVHDRITIGGLPANRVGFIRNSHTPYQGIIYGRNFSDVLVALMRCLEVMLGKNFFLDLDEMRLTERERCELEDLAARSIFDIHTEEKLGSRYLTINGCFSDILAGLSKQVQKEFQRKIRRMSRLGAITFSRIQENRQLEEGLAHFFTLNSRTWKGSEPFPKFYYRLCSSFADRGELLFFALAVAAEPIAYLIALRGGSTVYGIKTTYNPSYYAYSPGIILFYKAIEAICRLPGVTEFDIGRGHEQYKREWTSLTCQSTRVLIYPKTALWQIANTAYNSIIPSIKRNRHLNRVYTYFKSAMEALQKTKCEVPPHFASIDQGSSTDLPESSKTPLLAVRNLRVRYADLSDMDNLAVAMSARSLMEIQERFETERCILVLDADTIAAWFWASDVSAGDRACNDELPRIRLSEWGLNESGRTLWVGQDCLEAVLSFLRCKNLLVLSPFPAMTTNRYFRTQDQQI